MRSSNIELKIHGLTALPLYRGKGIGVVHPHSIVMDDNKGKAIYLYYTPYPPDEAELPYLSISADGRKFVPVSRKPLLQRGAYKEWDWHHLADIDIVRKNNVYLMYYAGASIGEAPRIKTVSIGLAISSDGVSWKKYYKNPVLTPDSRFWWERGTENYKGVLCPSIFYNDLDNKFYMYYSAVGEDGIERISLATSYDGFNFEKKGLVLTPSFWWERKGVNHPYVATLNGKIILLYIGSTGYTSYLGVAYGDKKNPAHLKKHYNPLLSPNLSSLARISLPYIGKTRLIYSGLSTFSMYTIRNPLWNAGRIYRSSLLTTPEREVYWMNRKNLSKCIIGSTLIYVSAYDPFFHIPSIGVGRVSIKVKGEDG